MPSYPPLLAVPSLPYTCRLAAAPQCPRLPLICTQVRYMHTLPNTHTSLQLPACKCTALLHSDAQRQLRRAAAPAPAANPGCRALHVCSYTVREAANNQSSLTKLDSPAYRGRTAMPAGCAFENVGARGRAWRRGGCSCTASAICLCSRSSREEGGNCKNAPNDGGTAVLQ